MTSMIVCRLSEILGKKRLKISDVIRATGITRPTLTSLYYDSGDGIKFETIDKLCAYLNIEPGELFVYKRVDEQCDT